MKCYCKNYQDIENYEKALADNFKRWQCHHRLETHNSDGERRLVDITRNELIALGMYYNRPAEELIFMNGTEHRQLHHNEKQHTKGMHHSKETKRKMSEAHKGEKNPMYGQHLSEETRKKMSEAKKDKHWRIENGKRIWY